ncbi:MAG: VWA domain-containing protein [Acidobacteria bacterium]|nr:VWA domain-containing protein [Acidobacteriota bacterium]
MTDSRRRTARGLTLGAALLLLATAFAPAPLLGAPSDEGGAPFIDRIEVNIVNVEVFVTTRKGENVTGLTRDDFLLTVDGKEVPITNFYAEEEDRPVYGETPPSAEIGGDGSRPEGPSPAAGPVPEEQRLRVVVFVDETALQPLNRRRSFKHIWRFLEEGLAPDDEVAVISLSPGLQFHTEFTRDRTVVESILRDLQKRPSLDLGTALERRKVLQEISDAGSDPASKAVSSGATLSLIRAIAASEYSIRRSGVRALTALMDTLAGVPGRKALLHVSDGIATNPGEDLFLAWQNRFGSTTGNYPSEVGSYDLIQDFKELAERANASKVTFYAVDADLPALGYGKSAEYAGDPRALPSFTTEVNNLYEANKRATLDLAASETGGRRVIANGMLPRQLDRLGRDFRTFYSLGFEAAGKDTKKSHSIKVDVVKDKGKGLRVRHRADYIRRNREERMASATLAALLYNSVDNPMEVSLDRGEGQKRDDGRIVVPVNLQIPLEKVTLLPNQGNHAARISLFVTVKDERGEARPVQKVPFALDIPDEFVEQAKGDSARYTLPLIINPGDQQVAIGIRDEIGATESTVRLELPRGL